MSVEREILAAASASLGLALGREPSAGEVVELLVENQVPLLSIAGEGPAGEAAGILDSESFKLAVHRQQAVYDEVHGNFERAACGWEARGIRSICFKSAGIAPSYPYTSENFDILFRPEDEFGAGEVLTELGYVLLANCDEPQKWLYRLFIGGRSVSAIHLHTRVGWGQGFMIEDEIWRRARPSRDDPVTWVPGPEDVILINSAHAFFENKAFGLHDLMKVRSAIADGVDWEVVEGVARARGWLRALQFSMAMMGRLEAKVFPTPMIPAARFESAVMTNGRMREQLDRVVTQPPVMPFFTSWKLVKLQFFDKIARDRQEPVAGKPALVFLSLARAVKSQINAEPQNSGLFAFSGIDGSGKTRQAEALAGAFDVCHLRHRVIWGRLGATPLMSRASRLWNRDGIPERANAPRAAAEAGERPASGGGSSRRGRGSGPRMVWAVLTSLDFALWLTRIRWRLFRGEIVIADRYLCDYDVELSIKLDTQSRLRGVLLGALRAVAPKPDRAFLLDVDAATALSRALPDGGDFDPDAGTGLYRRRSARYGLQPVDATEPFEVVSSRVERDALRAYFNRYGMLGNFFFFQNPWQLNRPVRRQMSRAGATYESRVATGDRLSH